MYFPEKGTFSMVEMSSVKIISDHETGDSYTILNGKLTSFNMQKILEKNMAQTNGGPMTVRKTGKTQKIHGYLCYEYILENDEYIITSMVTEEFAPSDIVNAKTIKRMRDEISTDYPGGFALRTINVEKSTGEKTTISVTSISKEQTIVDLSTF